MNRKEARMAEDIGVGEIENLELILMDTFSYVTYAVKEY